MERRPIPHLEQLSIDIDALTGARSADADARPALTGEQHAAVEARDRPLLLSAAAGSGKTSVLVERFVQAVCADGLAPPTVLAITFTERAAGELRSRVRERLLQLGEREAARDTEAAFIGTFHGFCARLLRAHPLPAGLDPGFAILDAARSAWLRRRAYEDALPGFIAAPGAVDLLAAYGVEAARRIVEQVYAELRSRGERAPRLPVRAPAPGAEADEADALAAIALFDRLLADFGARYEHLKAERLAVDFDDLELIAGELLAGNAAVRESWSERFALLMVDEFQDTNPRQLAILHALERGNLFTVGDELQSIYGFRHADVRLFRARRAELEASGGALALTSNFRSRGEVLGAVNVVFESRFEGFTRLETGRVDAATAGAPPAVEVLLTVASDEWREHPGAAAIAAGLPHTRTFARAAEARLLAQRVRELVDAGEAKAGEVAVLLRASGDIETFERALQLQGLRTLATVGTFWERQQITDLHGYLRALANPRDEEAVWGVLASPLGGLSRDALALIAYASAAAEQPGGVWETARAISAEGCGELAARDEALLNRLCSWFEAERAGAAGRGISELLERAISRAGYLEHVKALDWPERRLANVHKLLRLAHAFETSEGRDLRAFVDHVEELKRAGGTEPDAPVEDVEPDTVRLMTIHAAKGLEFPVVCVADLGRKRPSPDYRLFVDGERLGLRLWRPGDGEGTKTLEFDELRAERQTREREEESRVFYVAMTRARERLILSGAVDFHSWPKESDTSPPITWLGPALCPELPELAASGGGVHSVHAGGGRGPAIRITLSDPAGYGSVLHEPPGGSRAGADEGEDGEGSPAAPERAADVAPSAPPPERELEQPSPLPATLSYTSLSLLERCGYRYYLERVLRMPEGAAASGERGEGLEARARGTLAHLLLEEHDFTAPGPLDAARVAEAADELGLETSSPERAELAGLIEGALAAPMAGRIAASRRLRREHPFAFGLGDGAPLVTGVFDLLCVEDDGTTLLVDYKSDRLAAEIETEALVQRDYAVQRLLYGLAVLREGALVVDVVHWFLERPAEPAIARFTLAERPALEEQLAGRLATLRADPFAVSPNPHRGLCLTCPGRGGMCSWGEEETMREEPAAAPKVPA